MKERKKERKKNMINEWICIIDTYKQDVYVRGYIDYCTCLQTRYPMEKNEWIKIYK